jgi:tetratricopeptide (TPR) repeat protein
VADPRTPGPVPRFLLPLLALLLGGAPLAAQGLAPKRPPPEDARGCPAVAAPGATSPARRDSAEALVAEASEAAILGDDGSARDLFRRAAALDPTDASVAYRLARLHEDLGDRAAAVGEYCRYLVLAPESADAPEVAARAARLAPPPNPARQRAGTSFREGLRSLDRGDGAAAETAFSAALQARPDWPEAHFNRGLALLGGADPEPAAAALESYLRLSPSAPDSADVREAIRALRRPTVAYSPRTSLTRGLVMPGLGQFHTRRPVLGAAVLGGVGAALLFGMRQEEVTRTATAADPFGNSYQYRYRATERPSLAAGIGGAVAITLAGAAEAYLYARRADRGSRPFVLRGGALRPVLSLPTGAGGPGLEMGMGVTLR